MVEAYGRGEIELEDPPEGKGSGYLHFLPGGKKYSLATIARFLGWIRPSDGQATNPLRHAFDAYRTEATTKESIDKTDARRA